ncbi:MAG: ribose-phosphate pyrophosphokinase [Sideroxydans sp.]|jgi:ribose-phosphate pyrophosphokinase|nr:ribose-phosphate pyrophosphokinase [Methylotenera sp.]NOT18785.1 ribose-phosphate pyrophosphokinase [Sideroxydans sp.]
MKPVLLPLPGNEAQAQALAQRLDAVIGQFMVRRFPDGETYLRIETELAGRTVIVVATLDRPDDKLLPLLFTAATAKELGAACVGLVTPYLAYMRQDQRFLSGEAVTSVYFAQLLSASVDWLVTVDPHLHRRDSLDEIYSIPSYVVHAAELVSTWIRQHVDSPVIVGPDSESEQWVAAVASASGAPYVVLRKIRRSDHEVEVSVPDVERWRAHTPVLVDDIISTARTMIETVGHLRRAGLPPPICIGVHAIFAGDAYESLLSAGATRVVTCNTIVHVSNAIDLGDLLATGVRTMLVPASAAEEGQ